MSKRSTHLFWNHRWAIAFFLSLVLYSVVFVDHLQPWKVENYDILSYYAVDFSYGFATRLLPGAMFHALFGPNAPQSLTLVFLTGLMLLLFAGISLLLEKLLLQVPAAGRDTMLFLLLFFLFGTYTLSLFSKALGAIDSFWLFFSLPFFFFLEHRYLKYLIPVLFAALLMVHNGAVVSYIVLLAILLLYRSSLSVSLKERRALIAVLLVSLCAAGGLFVFFLANESRLICPMDVFHAKLNEHGCTFYYYYDYAFYDLYNGEKIIPDSVYQSGSFLTKALSIVYYKIKLNFRLLANNEGAQHLASFAVGILTLLPLQVLFAKFHIRWLKREQSGLKRFCSLLMLLQFPFTLCTALLVSEDITRWLTHAHLISFVCFLAVLFYEPEKRAAFLEEWSRLKDRAATKIYFLAYISCGVFLGLIPT